ncbi:MAG TPA: penicillin-binding protein C, partial [Spirochaetota bacterium]|nr:penicillin-binding protein C [Spirochaetota bacterium]
LQKVFFISGPRGQAGLWLLDGRCIAETGLDAGWTPEPGAHHLCLGDEEGNIVDSVQFEVRGGADK